MPILRTAPGSPFGRKARIAILHLGLSDRVRIVPAQPSNDEDPIHAINPLRKMPALETEEGEAIYDSPVILDYLDWLAGGGRIVPADPKARFAALTLQALADGLADSIVLIRYEGRWRDAAQTSQPWIDHQQKKIQGALRALDETPPASANVDVGQISVACALDFHEKHAGAGWRDSHRKLAAWLGDFARRVPAYEATKS